MYGTSPREKILAEDPALLWYENGGKRTYDGGTEDGVIIRAIFLLINGEFFPKNIIFEREITGDISLRRSTLLRDRITHNFICNFAGKRTERSYRVTTLAMSVRRASCMEHAHPHPIKSIFEQRRLVVAF